MALSWSHFPTPSRGIGRRIGAAIGSATFLAALTVAPAFHPATVHANDIASFTTVFGTDVVHAGFGGMRDDGTGTLTVGGVSGSVTKALLYWHGPTNSTDLSANAAVTFAGNAVIGTNIGLSSDNCWGYANSQAYRADVTSLVSGNGTYALAGFVKDSGNINVNGASLIVFFDDGNAANNRDVVLFDGNDSNTPNVYDADGWNISLPGINYTSGSANITMHVSDGQSFDDDALILNGSTLVPAGAVFQGDSVPFGTFDAEGHLWDIHSYDVTSYLSPGPNTLTLTTGLNSDCLSLVVAAIDLPAGSAPPTTTATTTDYTGDASVQYSDAATLSANLTETVGGAPVPGKTIGFTLGTQSTSASPTDSSGNVSTSLVVTQQPGTVTTVKAAFAGDVTFGASSKTEPFAINKEDCTVAYTGDILVNAANMTNLSAQFGELDSSPGDWTNKSITFTVTDASLNVQTFTAATNASGVASTPAALGPNVYSVGVSFAGDDYYLGCASSADTLVTVQAAGAKITGGGWFSQGTGRTSFGFNVISDVTGLHGQLQVRPQASKSRFHSTSVLTLNSSGNSGTWTGTGRWNGVAGYTFTISVVDNGTSGKKGDTISIVIKSPTNVTVFTTGGLQPLKGGNIVVH
jgi:hypothetical protein